MGHQVWTCAKNLASTEIRSPDRRVRSELHRVTKTACDSQLTTKTKPSYRVNIPSHDAVLLSFLYIQVEVERCTQY